MIENLTTASLEARVEGLEGEIRWWRRTAIGLVGLGMLAGSLAFRRPQPSPGPLEASALTLRNDSGTSVILSVRASGDLEARFSHGISLRTPYQRSAGFVLVNPVGETVARLGDPTVRPLGP